MEDSEKRRERLKAMRTEAVQAEASNYVEASAASCLLSNPLLESPAQEASFATQRFDYYTDPMAAFSANKRSISGNQAAQGYSMPPSNIGSPMPQFSSPVPGSRNPDMTPPAHQMQSHYSPNQMMYRGQGLYNSPASHWSPRSGPFPMHHGIPDAWGGSGQLASNSVSHRVPFPVREGNPGFQPRGSPGFNNGQGSGPWLGNSSSVSPRHGGNATHSGRGHRQWRGGSRSPFSGQSGGRGRGFHSGHTGVDSFYDKSMFVDPWQHLEPVVWRGQETSNSNMDTPGSSDSWLPKSTSTKKAKISDPSNKLTSQQSLAEYLAASFNEAASNSSGV